MSRPHGAVAGHDRTRWHTQGAGPLGDPYAGLLDGVGERPCELRLGRDRGPALARQHAIPHVLDAVDPWFVLPVFEGSLAAGANHLDIAMSLSRPDPEAPYGRTGVTFGGSQFVRARHWEESERLALVGMGVESGLPDVVARCATDHLFSTVDEIGTRDCADPQVPDDDGNPVSAPSCSIWTTIEERPNLPVIGEIDRGRCTVPSFTEPEDVLLMPRRLDARKVTFTYGLGGQFIAVLRTLPTLGLDGTVPVRVRSADPAHVVDDAWSTTRGRWPSTGPVRRPADGREPGRRARAAGYRGVVGLRRARP